MFPATDNQSWYNIFSLDNMSPSGKLREYTGALHGLDVEFCKTPRVSRIASRDAVTLLANFRDFLNLAPVRAPRV